jgi:hypothetical protein
MRHEFGLRETLSRRAEDDLDPPLLEQRAVAVEDRDQVRGAH